MSWNSNRSEDSKPAPSYASDNELYSESLIEPRRVKEMRENPETDAAVATGVIYLLLTCIPLAVGITIWSALGGGGFGLFLWVLISFGMTVPAAMVIYPEILEDYLKIPDEAEIRDVKVALERLYSV